MHLRYVVPTSIDSNAGFLMLRAIQSLKTDSQDLIWKNKTIIQQKLREIDAEKQFYYNYLNFDHGF